MDGIHMGLTTNSWSVYDPTRICAVTTIRMGGLISVIPAILVLSQPIA